MGDTLQGQREGFGPYVHPNRRRGQQRAQTQHNTTQQETTDTAAASPPSHAPVANRPATNAVTQRSAEAAQKALEAAQVATGDEGALRSQIADSAYWADKAGTREGVDSAQLAATHVTIDALEAKIGQALRTATDLLGETTLTQLKQERDGLLSAQREDAGTMAQLRATIKQQQEAAENAALEVAALTRRLDQAASKDEVERLGRELAAARRAREAAIAEVGHTQDAAQALVDAAALRAAEILAVTTRLRETEERAQLTSNELARARARLVEQEAKADKLLELIRARGARRVFTEAIGAAPHRQAMDAIVAPPSHPDSADEAEALAFASARNAAALQCVCHDAALRMGIPAADPVGVARAVVARAASAGVRDAAGCQAYLDGLCGGAPGAPPDETDATADDADGLARGALGALVHDIARARGWH